MHMRRLEQTHTDTTIREPARDLVLPYSPLGSAAGRDVVALAIDTGAPTLPPPVPSNHGPRSRGAYCEKNIPPLPLRLWSLPPFLFSALGATPAF